MQRFHRIAAALSLACAILAGPAAAQEKKEETKAAAADVKASILFQIKAAEDKLVQLAEATPADKFGWRPAEGVRSIGEVYAHVAGGNYFLPTFWGAKVPEGVDPRSFEKNGNDKAATIAAMKKSFDYVREQINALSAADLDRAIKIFGNDAHVIDAAMILASHGHEHLGQAIAYARSNKITPPWSQRGGE
ncbi:MAG TPA: DinB family protein [Thermoanaerobaculia bacterium]